MLLKFLRDRRASILPIFGIALVPLLVATGGVVDYTNAYDQRSHVQDAMDAAALAAGKQVGLMSTSAIEAEAESFFLANVSEGRISNIPELVIAVSGSTVDVDTTLHVPTYFLGMIGLSEFVFNLHAQVTVAMGTLEVAMALDNSGSMCATADGSESCGANSQIATLRIAAVNLATTLHQLAATSTKPDPIKIGLAPFAAAVNVGPGYSGAAWIDTGAKGTYHANAQECYAAGGTPNASGVCSVTGGTLNNFTFFDSLKNADGTNVAWGGCVEERPMPYDVSDDAPSTAANPTTEEKKTLFVPMFAADEPDNWTCSTGLCTYLGTTNSTRRYLGAPGGTRSYNNYLPDAGGACDIVTMTQASPAVITRTAHGLSAWEEIAFSTTGSLYTGLTAGATTTTTSPPYYVAPTVLAASTANTFSVMRTAAFTVTSANPAVFTSNSHGMANGDKVVIKTTGALYTGLTAYTDANQKTYTVASVASNTFQLTENVAFTATSANPTVLTSSAHGLTAGTAITVSSTGTLPGGLSSASTYYVANSGIATNTFRLSTTNSPPIVTITTGTPANFTSNGHGLTAGTAVVFSTTGGLPSGVTAGTTYYVISTSLTTNGFRVSTSVGGSAVNASGSQSGTQRFQRLVAATSTGSGTHSYPMTVKTSGSQSGTHSFYTLVKTTGSQSGTHSYSKTVDWTCQSGNTNCGGTGNGKSEETAFGGLNVAGKAQCKYGTPSEKATIASVSIGGIPGGPNFMCTTTALTPLTTSLATITTAINNQQAIGATNITAGVMWGWRMLSPGAPLEEGRSYEDNENQKILILMTDGANTYYPNSSLVKSWYGAWGYVGMGHLGTTSTTTSTLVTKMNERTALACANAKAEGITIYTIAFNVSDATTVQMLETCANDPSMAYQSGNNAELLAAFSAIGDDISLLRIAQ